ncbi:Crp/Fnr family transcriptional regulator [Afifella sp. JA880]|uniref:Crp/Fnr family transcriptional regulator n=1 Tax=Afifella sp. JA880 TaxID=2975280 RepID=UPI0021BB6D25|nr:Crp/Fnr family transcriptional regulator [Afifella sp. JA880]MCT8266278.1 Crp/Fnr family transcriptional regulator [Afifella sp. JA880]
MEPALTRKLEHFTRLSPEDKSELTRIASERVRSLPAHQDVIREEEKPRVVNLVLEGWACRYKHLEDGRRQIISFFMPGDLCDLNVFILKRMDHSIGTLTDVKIAEISQETLEAMGLAYPRILQALWWDALVSAAIQREWTVALGQRNATERLAHLFCEIFCRLRCIGLTEGSSCPLPLTQIELGDATGLSFVHINRTLQDLRRDGLIKLNRRRLVIPDLEALMRVGLFNPNYLHLDHEGRNIDANR